ncbi:MAG TPA: M56 family metallopeptidase, partial [Pirellulales bacterium]|nr:M56 family metallopeptidase [Pirellulales bacterium]
MNETQWFGEMVRCTLALSISAAVLAALTRLLKITSPRTQRIACCLVLLQGWLVVHPTLELPWGESHAAAPLGEGEPLAAPAPAVFSKPPIPLRNSVIAPDSPSGPGSHAKGTDLSPAPRRAVMLRLALAVWAGGVLVSVAIPLAGYGRFLHQVRGQPVVAPEWLDEWRQVLAECGLRRRIELRLTTGTGPLLCWTPRGYRVLVPERLWNELDATQRRMVLRHELAHCLRGDLWKSSLVRLLALPHWFNPFAWWAVRRFDEAAEWVCDALAPRNELERVDFAKVLLRLCLSESRPWSLTAAVGGRVMTDRVRRVVNPAREPDALIKSTALAFCCLALLLVAWLRVEVVARESEPPPAATSNADAAPTDDGPTDDEQATDQTADNRSLRDVDAAIIEALVKQQARFATCHIEYIATQQPTADAEPAVPTEERVEFGRDDAGGRWFRKANQYVDGVRKEQRDVYVEQNGKRAISVSQHNWNGLNPPMVSIAQPRPESEHAFDAEPLFGLFPHGNPLSSMLEKKRVQVRTVEGDAVLQWANAVADHVLHYHVRLSRAHEWLPVYYLYKLDGRPIRQWRATRIEQSGDVWYAAEGEFGFSTPSTFKVTRFEIGQP